MGSHAARTVVFFTPELRETVRRDSDEMHQLYHRGHTPKAKPSKSCNACSLKELCLPSWSGGRASRRICAAPWRNRHETSSEYAVCQR